MGGVGRGLRGGRSLVNLIANWGGSNLFDSQPGECHSFLFGEEKITPCPLVDSYLLRKVYKNLKIVYTRKATSRD